MTCRLLCLTFLVLGFGVTHAQERKQPTTHSKQLTQNLLEIMEKTESVDTFVVTLKLLLENKPFNRPEVIPAVILNAERLGIFGDNFRKGENDRTELFREMAEVLDELNKKPEKKATGHVKTKVSKTIEEKVGADLNVTVCPCGVAKSCEAAFLEPDDETVLQAMPIRLEYNSLYGLFGIGPNCRIMKEKVADDKMDPTMVTIPGQTRFQKCTWKCTVHYMNTIQFPLGFHMEWPGIQVLYVDTPIHQQLLDEAKKPVDEKKPDLSQLY